MIVINQQQTGYNNCDLTRVSTNHHQNRKSNQLINTKRVNYKLSDMHNYRYQFNCLSTFFVSKVIVIFFILIPIIFKSPIVNGERISTGKLTKVKSIISKSINNLFLILQKENLK